MKTTPEFVGNPQGIQFHTDWDTRQHPYLHHFINEVEGIEAELKFNRFDYKRYSFFVQCGHSFNRKVVAENVLDTLAAYFVGRYDNQIEQLKKQDQPTWIERFIIKLMGKYHFELIKASIKYKKYKPVVPVLSPEIGRSVPEKFMPYGKPGRTWPPFKATDNV